MSHKEETYYSQNVFMAWNSWCGKCRKTRISDSFILHRNIIPITIPKMYFYFSRSNIIFEDIYIETYRYHVYPLFYLRYIRSLLPSSLYQTSPNSVLIKWYVRRTLIWTSTITISSYHILFKSLIKVVCALHSPICPRKTSSILSCMTPIIPCIQYKITTNYTRTIIIILRFTDGPVCNREKAT